ncbi:methyltransferase domain-containing protein [Nakamurella sp. YIM 132087]|uniref:Methyltransferase domain-containing protein n=1 Tax=Nakamurella alba TaxID=2665158 RepID=A0A7K1FKR4_9ACTN|nr:methyltransferase domain-containing protein [Nakamurella alba]MTD13989.1 methyltransferase domain-containing protein [Nakamurella alba]
MTAGQQDFWEKHYRALDPGWGIRPNAVLLDMLARLDPPAGRALDLGAGHGGDAVGLAARGWTVTAADVAPTALARVTELAERNGVAAQVTAVHADLSDAATDLAAVTGGDVFDLVTASYFHLHDAAVRAHALRRAAGLLKPSGLLVVVDHASFAPWSWRGEGHPGFPAPEQTLAALDLPSAEWTTEICENRERIATGPAGETAPVTDTVIVVRRAV